MRNKICIIVFILFVIILQLIPTKDVRQVRLDKTFQLPCKEYPLGTDNLGRDVLSLMVEGCLRTLLVVFIASAVSLIFGVFFGMLAGYLEGVVELIIQFITDLIMIIPSFIVALIFTSFLGLNPFTAGIILGISGMGGYINQAAALTKKIKKEEFFQCEKVLGISTSNLILKHIFPNIIGPILTSFGNRASGIILSYASLAFIGLGTDIAQPDWGSMLYQYRIYIIEHPMLVLWPTLGIFILALMLHVLFDNKELIGKKRGNLYE